jgi:hypothetical protein
LIKPSLYVYDNKGKFFTNFKIGLNQFRVYLQKFQLKTENKKDKISKKYKKGLRGSTPSQQLNQPVAHLPSFPNCYVPLFFGRRHGGPTCHPSQGILTNPLRLRRDHREKSP